LIDAEAAAFIGAATHERSDGRVAVRNGSRSRTLSTMAGDLDLRIPKLPAGSFFPPLLKCRRRVDRAAVRRPSQYQRVEYLESTPGNPPTSASVAVAKRD